MTRWTSCPRAKPTPEGQREAEEFAVEIAAGYGLEEQDQETAEYMAGWE